MDRITGATVDLGSGRRGFRDRNLGLSLAGTIPGATWFNGAQEEIVRTIEILGLTPSDANREQLIQAMRRLAGGNVRTISSGGVTLTADDAGVVLVNASGSFGVTLPAAASAGGLPMRLTFIRTDASAGVLTILRAGSDTIDGATSFPLLSGQRVTLVSNGAGLWSVMEAPGGLRFGQTVAFSGGGGSAGFSGSWVVPSNVSRIMVRAWGAGGGGGGTASGSSGGGGGGGGYAEGWYQVASGVTLTVQAGTGGAAGGVSTAGTNGTGSFVSAPSGPVTGTLLSAGGGQGGAGATTGNQGAGGTGGTSSGGAFQPAGAVGQNGQLIGSSYYGGEGGAAPLAGGGAYPAYAGLIFGSGGSGGWNNSVAPGAGAGGLVTISW